MRGLPHTGAVITNTSVVGFRETGPARWRISQIWRNQDDYTVVIDRSTIRVTPGFTRSPPAVGLLSYAKYCTADALLSRERVWQLGILGEVSVSLIGLRHSLAKSYFLFLASILYRASIAQAMGRRRRSAGSLVMSLRISILIASTNSMVGELIAGALNRKPQFHVVASVTTAPEVLQAVRSTHVDVALISSNLADGPMSGLAVLRELRETVPGIKNVLILDRPEPQFVFDAFRAGVKGIFCPSVSPFKLLCKCVERIQAGQIWATSDQLAHVLDTFCNLAPMHIVNADGMKLLTKREEDVVRLLTDGLQNREIAQELNLSQHTIKNYLFHIFDKLGVSSRIELVLYAANTIRKSSRANLDSEECRGEVARVPPKVESPVTDRRACG